MKLIFIEQLLNACYTMANNQTKQKITVKKPQPLFQKRLYQKRRTKNDQYAC